MADAAAAASAPRSGPSGCASPTGPTSRPGPGAARLGVLGARGGHRPHDGRPGRDRARQPPAGGRARRAGRHASRAHATRCSPCGATRRRRSATASGWTRCATRPTRTPASSATGCATSCCPLCSAIAGRDVVPVLARQAGRSAATPTLLAALASLVGPGGPPGRCATRPSALARRARARLADRRRAPTHRPARRGGAGPRRGAAGARWRPRSPEGGRVSRTDGRLVLGQAGRTGKVRWSRPPVQSQRDRPG